MAVYEISYKTCSGSGAASDWTPAATSYTFTPKSLKVSIETVADAASGRTQSGAMYVNYKKSDLRKLEIELPPYPLGDASYGSILNRVVGKVCQVTYWDPYTNTSTTSKFYCSSGNGEYYSGVIMNGIVQGAAFNWIEME